MENDQVFLLENTGLEKCFWLLIMINVFAAWLSIWNQHIIIVIAIDTTIIQSSMQFIVVTRMAQRLYKSK